MLLIGNEEAVKKMEMEMMFHGLITLDVIIHLSFNYFYDTSSKSEQNFIQACFL